MQISGSDKHFLRRKAPPLLRSGRPVRLVDLFAGCGGLTLGVAEACRSHNRRFEAVLAMELNKKIREVYDANFSSIISHRRDDVLSRFDGRPGETLTKSERMTAKEVGAVDLIVGGPPCQGHSNLNNHTRRDDPKNKLYLVMVRATEVLRPLSLMIANVQGVVKDRSNVLKRAKEHLVDLGYFVDDGFVRLWDLGVPQTRVRHILLASRIRQPSVLMTIERHRVRNSKRDLEWAIGDLKQIRDRHGIDAASRLSDENLERARFLQSSRLYDLPNENRPTCHRDDPNHTYKSMYGRLHWKKPAHTITTGFCSPGQGRYLHPSQLRTITPHEAARLQFFPDWFDFGPIANDRRALAECIGNAVPPKLGFAMACELLVDLPDQTAGVGASQSDSDGDSLRSAA